MIITIKIATDNAAFQDGNKWNEVARIVAGIAQVLRDDLPPFSYPLRDSNGNTVGSVKVTGR